MLSWQLNWRRCSNNKSAHNLAKEDKRVVGKKNVPLANHSWCPDKIISMEHPSPIPLDRIESLIYFLRGEKVMLDSDLAELYGVETKALNRAVTRNIERFPKDFMFRLTPAEAETLRYQFGTSKRRGGRRYLPYVFTEQGVAMLSSVLHSDLAIMVNIQIVRTFIRLRRILSSHADLARKLQELETKYDAQFKAVFEAIRALMEPPPEPPKEPLGF